MATQQTHAKQEEKTPEQLAAEKEFLETEIDARHGFRGTVNEFVGKLKRKPNNGSFGIGQNTHKTSKEVRNFKTTTIDHKREYFVFKLIKKTIIKRRKKSDGCIYFIARKQIRDFYDAFYIKEGKVSAADYWTY